MNPLILTAWLACQTLDATTTQIALNRQGYSESNPIMKKGHIPIRLSVNLAVIVMSKKKNLTASIFAVSGCVVGSWNVSQLKRER